MLFRPSSIAFCRVVSTRLTFQHSGMAGNGVGHFVSFGNFKKLCEEGRLDEALQAVDHIDHLGVPFSTTFNCLLHGCINKKDFATCKVVYSLIMKHECELDRYLGSSLIRMFALCGTLFEANLVFSRVRQPDVFTWSSIILAHMKHGKSEQAIKLYYKMHHSGVKPDGHAFVAVLKACGSAVAPIQGQLIHCHIIEIGLELDLYVGNALISMYARCGSLEDARSIYNKLPNRDLVTWSSMIAGYSQHGIGLEAFEVFQQMQVEGKLPDEITIVTVLKACSNIAALDQGKLIHAQVVERGFELNVIVGSTLVDMYAKCGNLEDAQRVFDASPKRDMVTWSAIIAGYTLNSDYKQALQHFKDMQQEGLKPNDVIFLCLLSACSHMGLIRHGCELFNSMIEDRKIMPKVEHYNCMVDLLGRSGHLKEAEDILQCMPFQSNIVGWTSLLCSCKTYANVEVGRHCFDRLITVDCRDASGYVLMSNMYASAERWNDARKITQMKEGAKAWKKPGKAFIMVDDKVHEFVVGEMECPEMCMSNAKLNRLSTCTKVEGHIPI